MGKVRPSLPIQLAYCRELESKYDQTYTGVVTIVTKNSQKSAQRQRDLFLFSTKRSQ